MLFKYQHPYLDEIIECELDYYPADPENGYMHDSMELTSAKVKDVDIIHVLCDSIIQEIQEMALNKDTLNTD